jgi:hypothetical protein
MPAPLLFDGHSAADYKRRQGTLHGATCHETTLSLSCVNEPAAGALSL